MIFGPLNQSTFSLPRLCFVLDLGTATTNQAPSLWSLLVMVVDFLLYIRIIGQYFLVLSYGLHSEALKGKVQLTLAYGVGP